MFGDYVSLYLAALREVDPCNVDPIVDIKARIRAVIPEWYWAISPISFRSCFLVLLTIVNLIMQLQIDPYNHGSQSEYERQHRYEDE